MDPSSIIFVVLAVAWAVYLVPKLLNHHDEVVRSRSADRFSRSMRVLARREAVDSRNARLVVAPARAGSERVVETKARAGRPGTARPGASRPQPSPKARREAARRAAQRRRRVLGVILAVNAVVVGLAVASVVAWPWVAAPVALLVAWLVACRLMVRSERAARASFVRPRASEVPEGADDETGTFDVVAEEFSDAAEVVVEESLVEESVGAVAEAPVVAAEGLWDPVPTTLPTYVSKPAAVRRTVQTIDLDSTGVWSSGRSEVDSALAREAEASQKADKAAEAVSAERRVSGA